MPKTIHKNWALNLSTFYLCLSLLACVAHDGRSENAPALTDLIKALQATDVSDREDAAWDIGKLGPAAKAATPALIEVLRSLDSSADNQSELSDYVISQPLNRLTVWANQLIKSSF